MRRSKWIGLVLLVASVAVAIALALLTRKGTKPSLAASNDCDQKSCPEVKCGPGAYSGRESGKCCPVCLPIPKLARGKRGKGPCAGVICEPCPAGTRPNDLEPNQCCPHCARVDAEQCAAGLAQYETRWAQAEAELRACKTDDDCVHASFGDGCRSMCPMALNKYRIGEVVADLREEAAAYCELCQPPRFECKPAGRVQVACVNGRCEATELGQGDAGLH
jgi:hypothetical protein